MKKMLAIPMATYCLIGRGLTTRAYQVTSGYRSRRLCDKIIRVDHAGELGADCIYAGQLAVLGGSPVAPVIQEMWDQEKEHLAQFEALLEQHRARPSLLLPFWDAAGFLLGAGSALLGKESAMTCTVAVEEVIADHYNDQIRDLMADSDPLNHQELLCILRKFRDDEQHHHDTGLAHHARSAKLYRPLYETIKAGCRVAIWIAHRL